MIHVFSTITVVLLWLLYLPMFFGRGGADCRQRTKNATSSFGIALQFSGVAVIWIWRRQLFSPLPAMPFPASVVAPVVAVLIAAGSVWFSRAALRTLGKNWSFVAGVRSEHRLVKEGPYAIVRHPLYSCFFGLTLATGIVWSEPVALPLGIVLFWIGVWIRVHSEERVLREAFGEEFDRYVKTVPSFFPTLGREK